jgi:hypothetical protein
MKTKFFILVVLFLGIGAFTYAQTQAVAPSEKQDAPAQVSPDKAKTGECTGHQTMEGKKECKWVDANGDGKCDSCGKTEKECKEACAPKAAATKSGCASTCPHAKDCGKSAGAAPPKEK